MTLKYLNFTGLSTLVSDIKTWVLARIPTKTSEITNDSGYLTSHQSLSNYVTLNSNQTLTSTKSFTTSINTASPATSSRETWRIIFTKNDTNGTNAAQIGTIQFANTGDFCTIMRVANPRGNNKPTSGDGINTGNCWSAIGVYYDFDLNRGYPYAFACDRWSDSDNSNEHIASTSWVRRYCETTKGFLTSHQSLANYVTLNGTQTISGAKTLSADTLTGLAGNGYRIINGSSKVSTGYGVFQRIDSGTWYLMVTAKNDALGSWTTARPAQMTLSTGVLNINGNAANVTGTVAIANGGTGATSRLNAVKNLTNENVGTSTQYFLTITSSWGKAGYCSVANAKTVLGLGSAAYTASTAYAAASHTHTKSQITDFPTKVSAFTNDAGYLTSHQSLSNYSTLANTVKSLSISGKTITVTPGSGSAYTLTTQDTVYTHPTTAGNKHIPSGGAADQYLKYSASGTAVWADLIPIFSDEVFRWEHTVTVSAMNQSSEWEAVTEGYKYTASISLGRTRLSRIYLYLTTEKNDLVKVVISNGYVFGAKNCVDSGKNSVKADTTTYGGVLTQTVTGSSRLNCLFCAYNTTVTLTITYTANAHAGGANPSLSGVITIWQ